MYFHCIHVPSVNDCFKNIAMQNSLPVTALENMQAEFHNDSPQPLILKNCKKVSPDSSALRDCAFISRHSGDNCQTAKHKSNSGSSYGTSVSMSTMSCSVYTLLREKEPVLPVHLPKSPSTSPSCFNTPPCVPPSCAATLKQSAFVMQRGSFFKKNSTCASGVKPLAQRVHLQQQEAAHTHHFALIYVFNRPLES